MPTRRQVMLAQIIIESMLNAGPILLHVRQILSVIRFRPFDVSTPAGRSQERYRRAALTAIAQIFSRLISFASLLISVPLALHYLHEERYGIWMTISSVAVLLGFAD